jgi:hypothetical protein
MRTSLSVTRAGQRIPRQSGPDIFGGPMGMCAMLEQDPGRKAHRQFNVSERVLARLGLPFRFCAAAMVGIALIVGSIVVWAVASIVVAVVGDEPPKRSIEQRRPFMAR